MTQAYHHKEENQDSKPYKKPAWYKQAERQLRSYKNLPMEIENLELQMELDQLAGTSITQKYKNSMAQASGKSSPIESVVTKEEALRERLRCKQIRLKMLDNVIKSFNLEERQVYYLRYEVEKRDKEVYTKLRMSRSAYFELQRKVVLKAARLLSIPIPNEDLPEEWRGRLFEILPWGSS